ncbi:MAG: hypothetical protein ACREQ4_03560, partial [Candidatus Binataceae bacterium]
MLNILVPALWILFDISICLRTGYMTAPFSRAEWWCWLVAGLLLAALAVIAGWWDRRKTSQETDRRHKEHSRDHEVLAGGAVMMIERLACLTQTTGSPDTEVLKAAERKLEELSRQVLELARRTRHVTSDQRQRFGRALPSIVPELFQYPPNFSAYRGVRVIHGST